MITSVVSIYSFRGCILAYLYPLHSHPQNPQNPSYWLSKYFFVHLSAVVYIPLII